MKALFIFAHPDDEAFGPGGTMSLWISQGSLIHLLCATKGEAGKNISQKETARVRSKELKASAKVLGIEKIQFLGLKDGQIGNNDLAYLEKKISQKVKSFQPDLILTFDLNGVSGHLDHIAVASATTQSFKKTKVAKYLYYFTITQEHTNQIDDHFIYLPEGKLPHQIHQSIDVSSVWEKKLEAMYQHKSQIEDIEFVLRLEEQVSSPKHEHFLIRQN